MHDALYDRDLLRAVDHRLSSVLDRLLTVALSGQTIVKEWPTSVHYISLQDPLTDALWRRLATLDPAQNLGSSVHERRVRSTGTFAMQRVDRATLLIGAHDVGGVEAVTLAMTILEGIDEAVSLAAEIAPSPISVHQDMYGPDEMAHTDRSGISVNLASGRVRALLVSALHHDAAAAFGALVDLVLHEKNACLARELHAACECGTWGDFFRRKDQLRRRLLEAVAKRKIGDPISWLRAARRGLKRFELPAPEALAAAFRGEAA